MNKREAKKLATQYAAEVLPQVIGYGEWIQILEGLGLDPDGPDGLRFCEAFGEVANELRNRYGLLPEEE